MAKNHLVGNITSTGLTGGSVSNVSSGIAGDVTSKTSIVEYKGGKTNTATVNVDNTNHIITVDAKIDVEQITEELEKANNNYNEIKLLSEELKSKCASLETQQTVILKDLSNLQLDYSAFKLNCEEKFSAVNKALADTIEVVDSKVAGVQQQLTSLQTYVHNEIEQDINELKVRVTKCESDIEDTKNKLELTITQVNLLQSTFETFSVEINEKVDTVNATLTNKIEELGSKEATDIANVKSLIQGVDSKVVDLDNRESSDIIEVKSLIRENITEVKGEISALGSKESSDIADVNSRINEVSSRVTSLDNRESADIIEVKSLIQDVDNKVITLGNKEKEDIATVDTKISDVGNRVSALDNRESADIISVKSLIQGVDGKVDLLKSSTEKSLEELSAKVDSFYSTLDTRITSVKSEMEGLVSDVDDKLDKAVVNLQKQIDEVKKQMSPELAEVKADIKALKDGKVSVEVFNAHVEEANKKIENLKKYVDDADNALKDLFNTKLEDKVSNAQLQETITQLKKYTDDAIQIINNDFQPRLAIIEQDIIDLKSAHQVLQERQTALENRMDEIIIYFLKLFEEQKVAWNLTFAEFKVSYEERMKSFETLMDTKYEILKAAVYNLKPECMYYDKKGTHDPSGKGRSYWYMSGKKSDPEHTILAGPYDFGTGGGGGGTTRASQIYFDEDIMVTKEVGYLTTGLLDAAGRSVEWLFNKMLTKIFQPTKTNPSASISINGTTSSEVGNKITPSWSVSFSAGSYTYGPATGCTSTQATIVDCDHTDTTILADGWTSGSGSFNEIVYADNPVTKTAQVTEYGWTDSTSIAYDSVGGISDPPVTISAQSGQQSYQASRTFTGFRNFFYDCSSTAPDLTSAGIRRWTKGGVASRGTTFSQSIDEGSKFVYISILASTGVKPTHVKDRNAFGTDIVGSFKKHTETVLVEGANGYEAKEYNVWVYDTNGTPLASNTYDYTLG